MDHIVQADYIIVISHSRKNELLRK